MKSLGQEVEMVLERKSLQFVQQVQIQVKTGHVRRMRLQRKLFVKTRLKTHILERIEVQQWSSLKK